VSEAAQVWCETLTRATRKRLLSGSICRNPLFLAGTKTLDRFEGLSTRRTIWGLHVGAIAPLHSDGLGTREMLLAKLAL
jgi:hypothetical protein